ncbi:MAG: sialidase, partial [Candidatus Aminicenantes bacterium]|nr:sialidase [Candidatus Aminicenantes bacterium]
LVHITRDAGKTWTNVTPPGMPPWGTVSMIDPSRFEAGRCYIAVDGHQENIRDPYLFKTADYGRTWTRIDAGTPRSVLSYTSAIKEDPVRKGLLYAGTANAIFVSFDDGATWKSLQANLPHACITWIAFQEHFNDLVVGTNGRSIWILDDVTPLQQLTPEIERAEAHLFKPRPAYRFKARQRVDSAPNDQSQGRSAPYGASINYYLKEVPGSGVKVEILDENGQKVRTLRGTANEGLNRVWWNLRHEPLLQIELRTTPAFHPHVWEEKRFLGQETRPVLHWGIGSPQAGVLTAPGTYTVKLIVNGKEYAQRLEVRKDPNSRGTEADIRDTVQLWKDVVQDINEVVTMINRLEWVGKQMEDLEKVLTRTKDAELVIAVLSETHSKVLTVEDKLLQRQLHASDPKSYRDEMMLYSKLLWFSGEIGTGAGDIRNTEDFGPTNQQLEVHDILKRRLDEVRMEYDRLLSDVIPALNKTLQAAGHGAIITILK